MGERHDLGLEPAGWAAPGFGPDGWRPVRVRERDGTPLVADPGPPVRVTQEIAPRSIASDDSGRHIVDFGQNLTGWVRGPRMSRRLSSASARESTSSPAPR